MQASNPPFIRFCKKLGLLPEKVSFYLSDSFFLLLSLVIAFCIRAALPGFSFDLTLYLKIVLIVLLGPLCLGLPLGVYMGIPTPRYNELRRIVTFVSITFATAIAFLFLAKMERLFRGAFSSEPGFSPVFSCLSGACLCGIALPGIPGGATPLWFLIPSRVGKNLALSSPPSGIRFQSCGVR